MTDRHRVRLLVALLAWAVGVAFLTLVPGDYYGRLTLESFLCLGCGWRGSADIVLNWCLFVPLGACLTPLVGLRRAVVAGLTATLGIEVLQVWIPGRSTALQDLLSNSLGAASGSWVVARGAELRWQGPAIASAVVVWLAPALLLVPAPPGTVLWSQWTPRFGEFEPYRGEVLEARIGDMLVPPGPIEDDEALRERLSARGTIAVTFVAGPPPASIAPVVNVADAELNRIYMIAADGEDLVLWSGVVAGVVGLDEPDARWPGALAQLVPGDTVRLVVERTEGSVCVRVADRSRCALAPGMGSGWRFLMSAMRAPHGLRTALDIVWSIGVGLVLGLSFGRRGHGLLAGAGLAVAGLVVALWSPDVRPDLTHAAALLGGSAIAPSARPVIRHAWTWLFGSGTSAGKEPQHSGEVALANE